ncbi:PQQ-binding-like beta-propeller repeat protein [Ruania alkalisoli]|uniref:PQQ-binding-like beta-propeller repeat protein n=1 Tax=Ruania alkalisoli TaxID=2779775 RepID=A0A7M1SSI2_9MICO|nr:PQQ-binding-like beta-propeller repeat protein [Ruania alkalisoli]QOR70107.1 PQQ-binding-like beta-propeller repeat protein [Ruania alkalisoli]
MGTRDVEEFALDSGSDDATLPRPGSRGDHSAPHRLWPGLPWVAAALTLILAGVVAAPAPGAVVSPWGYVPGLGEEPELAWELETTEITGMWAFRGVLAIAELEQVRGIDAASGAERWRVESKAAQCGSDGSRLTCTSIDDEIIMIDPVSGNVDDSVSVPGAYAATAHDDDIIVATSSAIQRIRADGTVVWSTPLPEGTPVYAGPAVIDGHVLVGTDAARGGQPPPLDVETGEPGDPAEVGQTVYRIRDGAWVTSHPGSLWLFLRGETVRSMPATAPAMIVTTDPSLLDSELPATDDEWHPLAILPDVAIGNINDDTLGSTLMAIDTSTGEELWRSEALMHWFSTPIVDRDTLAAPVLNPELGRISTVIALNVDTGEERWRIDRATELYGITAGGGYLFLQDALGISAWELTG